MNVQLVFWTDTKQLTEQLHHLMETVNPESYQ